MEAFLSVCVKFLVALGIWSFALIIEAQTEYNPFDDMPKVELFK